VQAVGPEHFGIVAVDCAKRRSKWMLCNFYGKVIIEPTTVEHTTGGLRLTTQYISEVCRAEGLTDTMVAVEMTGIYHKPVPRAFRKAGFADLFEDHKLFHHSIALPIILKFTSADAIRTAGVDGIARHLNQTKVRFQTRTIARIVAWASTAAEPSELAAMHTRQWQELNEVRQLFGQQIAASELWKQQKVDPRDRRCRIANCRVPACGWRMVYQLVGGRQLWRGRGVDREYLLAKLQEFHRVHQT
jgi:hypothetical protein